MNLYGHYRLIDKYATASEMHSRFREQELVFLREKESSGYMLLPITFTFKEALSPHEFKRIGLSALKRFHSRLSRRLDRNIFENHLETVPILVAYPDRDDKPKFLKKSLLDHLEMPHFHGFLLIHPSRGHQRKVLRMIEDGRLQEFWRGIKLEGSAPCSKIEIRPMEKDLETNLNYNSNFLMNPDCHQYLIDPTSPSIILGGRDSSIIPTDCWRNPDEDPF